MSKLFAMLNILKYSTPPNFSCNNDYIKYKHVFSIRVKNSVGHDQMASRSTVYPKSKDKKRKKG